MFFVNPSNISIKLQYILCLLFIIQISGAKAQNTVLVFDGINDYVDLGSDAGNNIRTIEMWFKLDEEIDSLQDDFMTLVAREISTIDNTNEFSLSFQPSSISNSGKLRFDIDGTEPFKSVYSDARQWEANRWYHVAAVIDPTEGMKLFINGVKQKDSHRFTGATSNSGYITTLGCWGNKFSRLFKGRIDDVRFSSEAIYKNNFTPPCPDIPSTASTIGVWNFNEESGTIAIDSSNNNNGQLVGATRIYEEICDDSNSQETTDPQDNSIIVYPNPSYNNFHFVINDTTLSDLKIVIYNTLGQVLYTQIIKNQSFDINLIRQASAIYYYQIADPRKVIQTGKLLKM